jgi:hypothetical protein
MGYANSCIFGYKQMTLIVSNIQWFHTPNVYSHIKSQCSENQHADMRNLHC